MWHSPSHDVLRHCFYPVSPAPGSTNFSFSYLPFIDPSTYYCPDLNKGYNKFGGLQSDSETQNEVSSFSTFPTSLFALKPSRQGPAALAGLSDKPPSSNFDKEKVSPDLEKEPDKLAVPPTHLSHVGLPVQIHVGNLKHLPKKDIPTPSASEVPTPPSLPVPVSSSTPLPNDTGPSSNEKSPPPLNWQICTPSSSISSLDKSVKRAGMFSRRNRTLTTQMVADITSQLKAAFSVQPVPKSDPPPPPPLAPPTATAAALLSLQQQQVAPPPPPQVPPVSTAAPVVSSTASTVSSLSLPLVSNRTSAAALTSNSTIPPLPIQTNKLVSSLMLDQRTMETALAAREKVLAPIVHHNSPNGSVHDLFNHAKLQAEAEKEIKHALAAGYVLAVCVHVHVLCGWGFLSYEALAFLCKSM